MTYYPDPATTNPGSQTVDLAITGIPSTEVNVALFVIDRMRSNSYTAAGGSAANPFPNPDPELIPGIRQAQELALARPITHGVELTDDTWRERLRFEPYTTICIWITPYSDEAPEPPAWLAVDVLEDRAVLRWEPSRSPSFFSYEVFRREGDAIGERLSPYPLRAAVWVDDRPGRDYGVRTISASGIPGPIAR
jgi:hypothetical protein